MSDFDLQKNLRYLLSTKYDPNREQEAIEILQKCPNLAKEMWLGPDNNGNPFVYGSTALHYAANDGKITLMRQLIEFGADVNAHQAKWYATPMAWAANNAHIGAIRLLLAAGGNINGANIVHAAAFGGSSCGSDETKDYLGTLKFLYDNGADMNSRIFRDKLTPLSLAIESGNKKAQEFLRSIGAVE